MRKYLLISILLIIGTIGMFVIFTHQGNITIQVIDEITKLPVENAQVHYRYIVSCLSIGDCNKTIEDLSGYTNKDGYFNISGHSTEFDTSPIIYIEINKDNYIKELTRISEQQKLFPTRYLVDSSFFSQKVLISLIPKSCLSSDMSNLMEKVTFPLDEIFNDIIKKGVCELKKN